MAYVATPDEQARKLRAVRMAAASAVGNGCDPDEVRRQVEAGIAEVLEMNSQRAEVLDGPSPRPATPALDAWSAQVA